MLQVLRWEAVIAETYSLMKSPLTQNENDDLVFCVEMARTIYMLIPVAAHWHHLS